MDLRARSLKAHVTGTCALMCDVAISRKTIVDCGTSAASPNRISDVPRLAEVSTHVAILLQLRFFV